MPERNLGITDYAVSRAIMELHQQYELINAQMIAERINGERTAVYRSIRTLREADLLEIKYGSSRAGGFRYEYKGE
ncbi:MAG: hypothetical protein AAF846_22250 [Chloroflexota bacterium]